MPNNQLFLIVILNSLVTAASSIKTTDPVHPNQHRCDRSRERSIDSRLSGCIFFPEFLLFIDSPIDCMDIHTVGGEYEMKESNKRDTCRSSSSSSKHQNKHEYLPPRWHGVVPHDFAVENAMLAPDRNGEFPDDWKSMYINNHKIALPHDENIFEMVRYLCMLYVCSSIFACKAHP